MTWSKKSVIKKMTEPTDWVSSIVISRRKNGKLRICLDPKDLNKVIKRCHHKTPTLEEITHKFSGSRYYSELDAKNGYWSVVLDEESSRLTTFNSPFGRYCFRRMPFGLVMSQDVFQHRMDQILEKCPGTVSIADDIVVCGKTEAEHDWNLHNLMEVAKRHGLVFNSEKCELKVPQIKFFGMMYDKDGVHPDPVKVKDIKQRCSPESKTELQEFLGMVTYMSPFIPKLAEHTASLRSLLKKGVVYVWTESHEQDFQKIKGLICQETTLTYFNVHDETVIQVDASSRGLGAVLLQNNKPIAFASKSLSDAEQRYANIERELLAVVFGCERFHTYVYGKHFTIESDHKPLEMIQQKPLTAAPPRLQRMLLRLQTYDVKIRYLPGKEMMLADSLSRSPSKDSTAIDLDLQIHHVQFTPQRLDQIRRETKQDAELKQLMETIVVGWPEKRRDVPRQIQPYWPFRDELAVEDGLVLKGPRVIIPRSLTPTILSKLHVGHQGVEKSKLRAKDCVYWVNLSKDIETTTAQCPTCQQYRKSQTRETLLPHEVPTRPWQTLGTGLFEFEGDNYLIIVDYYSKFPFIEKMPVHCTAKAVVEATKKIFSEQGIPQKVVSDNGPQFSASSYGAFAKEWRFLHVTSCPHYPQSNGLVERFIQTVKHSLAKAKASGNDPNMALLCIRTTPVDSNVPSPGELLFGRKLQGNLPVRIPNRDHRRDEVYARLVEKQQKQKNYYDQHARDLSHLVPGQEVRIQDHRTKGWEQGVIRRQCQEPRSYVVESENGNWLRRNRRHIQTTTPSVLDREVEAQEREEHGQSHASTWQNSNEQQFENQTMEGETCRTVYRTRSGRAVRKPERYGQ